MSDRLLDAPSGSRWRHALDRVNWSVVAGIGLLHLGLLLAPFTFTWTGLVVAIALYWLTGALGVTLGYHRLLTHRSFKTYKWVEYLLTLIAGLSWQGGAVQWVGIHRLHHKHSDHEHDPHSPQHGFTWAHMLWCMLKEEDGQRGADAARDLQRDTVHRWIDRLFWVPQIILAAVLFGLGEWAASAGWSASGLSWVIWGVCVRTVTVYHATWFVNSASHTWGYRNFDTPDGSTNLWWVALLGFGEGWHNNHHADQRSAAHGMRWYEFDLTYLTIRLMEKVGLAWDVVMPKELPAEPEPAEP